MSEVILYAGGVLVLAGAIFGALAALGILRLPDVYTRLHAASKAGVVGAGLILVGVLVVSGDASVGLRAVLGVVFLLLTTPVSAHLLARAAYLAGLRPVTSTTSHEMGENRNMDP